MTVKTTEARKKLSADYRVAWLSFLGFLGFVFGCLVMFNNDLFENENNNSGFHEIGYNPGKLANDILIYPIDSLTQLNKRRWDTANELAKTKTTPSNDDSIKNRLQHIKADIKKDSLILDIMGNYALSDKELNINDSSGFALANRSLHFEITSNKLDDLAHNFDSSKNDFKDSIGYFFKTKGIPFIVPGTAHFKTVTFNSDINFITKYPLSGTWLLLILIFTSFAFITVSTCIYLRGKIGDLFTENNFTNVSTRSYFFICAIVIIVLLLLASLWKHTFYDGEVVKNLFFMASQSDALAWIVKVGYIAGAFCLAGFIYTAGLLGFITDNIKSIKKQAGTQSKSKHLNAQPGANAEIASDKQEEKPAGGNAVDPSPVTNGLEEEKIMHEKVFKSLKKYFDIYFILSASILSLMVLCTGGLYSTVNSLDFVKLIADDWGYSPARTDFVYLYGALHTIILLMVYVPAKMRFNEMAITHEVGDKETDSKWYKFLQDPFSKLKESLVAASPLLASIVQSLLDSLFN